MRKPKADDQVIIGYHFAEESRRLRFEDGRKMEAGATHKVEGSPVLCQKGLHASKKLIDAIRYAPGPILFLTLHAGEFDIGKDKFCSTKRTYLAEVDLSNTLREFARKQALINIEKIIPYCSKEDYSLICKWLKSGDSEELRGAAWSAARAAWSVAESAAWSAAESVAWGAAWSAAESAAWSAARSAAWSAADKMLSDLIKKNHPDFYAVMLEYGV